MDIQTLIIATEKSIKVIFASWKETTNNCAPFGIELLIIKYWIFLGPRHCRRISSGQFQT